MKAWQRFFQQFGSYVLAVLCVAAILLSALWTRNVNRIEAKNQPAHFSQAQRLEDVKNEEEKPGFLRPVSGKILLPYSDEPVYFPQKRCYAYHFSTHLAVEAGEKIKAAFEGTVLWQDGTLLLRNAPHTLQYLGVSQGTVRDGQQVKQGSVIGEATGSIQGEGENILCLTLYEGEQPVNLMDYVTEE